MRFISDVKNFFKKSRLDLETGIWFEEFFNLVDEAVT